MLSNHRAVLTAGAFSVFAGSGPPQPVMLDLEFAQLSDPGRVREHNEDHLGYALPATPAHVRSHGWLFALADGVGGQEHGEIASQAAVESVVAGFRDAPAGEPHSALLTRLVQAANVRVFEAGHLGGRSRTGMATTIVACALRFDRVVVAHVGDSRCYLIRRGQATALTRDHTFSNEQARLGLLTVQEAADSLHRHLLSRALGTDLVVNVETSEHHMLAGDVLLLSSDGLHGALTGEEMARLVRESPDLNSAAQKLVALANQKDGSDNISVQLIRVRSVERVGMYRGRPYRLA